VVTEVTELRPRTTCKRERQRYLIEANPAWLRSLPSSQFRGAGAPRWWRWRTEWLWESPYCDLTPAEIGALVRLVCMFARSHDAYTFAKFETHRKELNFYQLSDALLRKVCKKLPQLTISVITESGEFKDL